MIHLSFLAHRGTNPRQLLGQPVSESKDLVERVMDLACQACAVYRQLNREIPLFECRQGRLKPFGINDVGGNGGTHRRDSIGML